MELPASTTITHLGNSKKKRLRWNKAKGARYPRFWKIPTMGIEIDIPRDKLAGPSEPAGKGEKGNCIYLQKIKITARLGNNASHFWHWWVTPFIMHAWNGFRAKSTLISTASTPFGSLERLPFDPLIPGRWWEGSSGGLWIQGPELASIVCHKASVTLAVSTLIFRLASHSRLPLDGGAGGSTNALSNFG